MPVRKGPYKKRSEVAAVVAKGLRDFGYPDCTDKMIEEVLAAYLAGEELPHGILGKFAQRQFEEVEQAAPGLLADLATD